ncbi:MAG TPA: hypothetical protein VFX49_03780 [Chloroflexota bacterium]|nr:hypothetical protein [Chloroflexota bacterium]
MSVLCRALRAAWALALVVAALGPGARVAAAQSAEAARAVSLKRAVLVVTGTDPVVGQVLLMEKLLLQNAAAEPYQPARWEESVVRVRVPKQAVDVSIDSGPPGADFVRVPTEEGVYAFAAPLPPGEQSIVISYALPYSGATSRIAYAPAMPAQGVQVLLPAAAGPDLQSASRALKRGTDLTIGSQRYLLLEGSQLAAGADAAFELRGLPVAQTAQPGRALPGGALAELPLVITASLLLAGALVYGLVQR